MTQLIKETFSHLKQKNKKAVIPFLTANFPNRKSFLNLLHELPNHGADIIEIGIPFSDPMADGETIQKTSLTAIQNGFNLEECLSDIAHFKALFPKIPIVIMSYVNPLIRFGINNFLKNAEASHVDGLLLVDVPAEHHSSIINIPTKLDIIRLITPTTSTERLELIQSQASGFIYYVSVKGITGSKTPDAKVISGHLSLITSKIKLPMVIGFGISDSTIAKEMATISDGVVIGSSFIKPFIDCPEQDLPKVIKNQLKFIQKISKSVNNA